MVTLRLSTQPAKHNRLENEQKRNTTIRTRLISFLPVCIYFYFTRQQNNAKIESNYFFVYLLLNR